MAESFKRLWDIDPNTGETYRAALLKALVEERNACDVYFRLLYSEQEPDRLVVDSARDHWGSKEYLLSVARRYCFDAGCSKKESYNPFD